MGGRDKRFGEKKSNVEEHRTKGQGSGKQGRTVLLSLWGTWGGAGSPMPTVGEQETLKPKALRCPQDLACLGPESWTLALPLAQRDGHAWLWSYGVVW